MKQFLFVTLASVSSGVEFKIDEKAISWLV